METKHPSDKQLSDFAAGRLVGQAWDTVDLHLSTCENCASRIERLPIEGDDILANLKSAANESQSSDSAGWQRVAAEETQVSEPALPLTDCAESKHTTHQESIAHPEYIGRYKIIRVLGQGAFGVVYLADDTTLDRQAAIKVPRLERFGTDELEVFVEEARNAAQLEHPRIVRVYDVQEESNLVYVVEQYIDGPDLAEYTSANPLSPLQIAQLMIAVAEGVGYAHEQHFWHRDLKPANLLLDSAGNPYVADFGLSLHESMQHEKAGEVAGTPEYMSPEQVRGEAHRLDGRSDIWSLGVILYELLTRERPFSGENRAQLLDEIQHRDPKPPRMVSPDVPRELARICMTCLAKRATDRYQSTADLVDDLRHWLTAAKPESTAGSWSSGSWTSGSWSSSGHTEVAASSRAALESATGSGIVDTAPIVPRGLRSFDASDADFFLELLPGPHDRNGLPQSIRFWKALIEQTDPDETFAVGLMYGPSGCGKSSLVKAGLLPRLNQDVLPVYVEATATETEVRLAKSLRKRCPEITPNDELWTMISRLRAGGGSRGRKVLLVLDQFEQWLHACASSEESNLVRALRQCDGAGVQCVLLVRDDFWMSTTAFMQALEVPCVEGKNSAAVPRFGTEHAQKVLTAFGRAYGNLPNLPAQPNQEQAQFVASAVQDLADADGKLVCVRLAVFAEMMQSRPWHPESLQSVGGTEGVGLSFLDEMFSTPTAPPAHRVHQEAVRAVLKSLLPDHGTDIKGQKKSFQQLLQDSGYQDRPANFEATLQILDGEVRLITPTESEGADSGEATTSPVRYYQLSHDFLVPSVREWLTRKQQETRRGRAELQLAERAALWGKRPENRYLPSWWEYRNIRYFTERHKWDATQRKMMRAAGGFYGVRIVAGLALVGLLVIGGLYVQNRIRVEMLVTRLLNTDAGGITELAKAVAQERHLSQPRLLSILAVEPSSDEEKRRRLHAQLAVAHFDSSLVKPLHETFLKTRKLEYLPAIRLALEPYQSQLSDQFWTDLHDLSCDKEIRFRSALALAGYEPDSDRWTQHDYLFVVEQLVANPVHQHRLWPLLSEIGERLLDPLEVVFCQADRPDLDRESAAAAFAEMANHNLGRVERLLPFATPRQYRILYPLLADRADRLRELVAQQPSSDLSPDERILVGKRRADAAITLLRQGEAEPVFDVLRVEDDQEALTQFVHRCRDRDVSVVQLVDCLERVEDLRKDSGMRKSHDAIQYALIMAIGEYGLTDLPSAEGEQLTQRLIESYKNDPSSAVHSATGWLLRRWGFGKTVAEVDRSDIPYDATGERDWFVLKLNVVNDSPVYFTFMVFPPGEVEMGSSDSEAGHQPNERRHRVQLTRPLAVSDREVTWEQFNHFDRSGHHDQLERIFKKKLGSKEPTFGVNWFEAVAYCRWLTEQRPQMSESDQCYEQAPLLQNTNRQPGWVDLPNSRNWPIRLDRRGFRLLTEAEWEFVCRGGFKTPFSFGHDHQLLNNYAWFQGNSETRSHPVAELRPNLRGLFDMHGNLFEWCHDWFGDYPKSLTVNPTGPRVGAQRVCRGGDWNQSFPFIRSAYRNRLEAKIRVPGVGFRVAFSLSAGSTSGRESTAMQARPPKDSLSAGSPGLGR